MKATMGSTYRTLQAQINQMSYRLLDLRTVATTGKRVNKGSDDPAAIRPILQARNKIRINDRYLNNLGTAFDKMMATESHLSHSENILDEIKTTAISSINGILTAGDRSILADKIAQLRAELLDSANSQIEGKYAFAGFAETTKPFAENANYSPGLYDPSKSYTRPVSFSGDANAFNLEIAPGEQIQLNISGSGLFLGDADNNGELDQVIITAGANDAIDFKEDPIGAVGLSAELSATITAGTYSFASLATEIETQMEAASVASGNSIDYTVTYDNTAKKFTIAGAGLDEMKILWSTGTNSAASAATTLGYIPNTDSESAATYAAYYAAPETNSGTDIFAVITRLEAALRADDTDAIEAEFGGLDKGIEQIRRYRSQLGNIGTRIEKSIEHLNDVGIDLEEMLSRYQDADIVQAITNMTQQETAFQAALNVVARVSNISILNYL